MGRHLNSAKAAALALALAALIAGCGGASSAGSGSGTAPAAKTADQSGAQVFSSAGCGGCHTLAAAHSSGTVGPDLNVLKPSYAAVVLQVEHGGGAMPSFKGSLSAAEIRAVARYVAESTR